MESLRAYLKTLSPEQRADFAKRCGTSIGYLNKALSIARTRAAKRQRPPQFDGALVRLLSAESNGAVSSEELRPDIFGSATAARKKKAA